MTREEKIIYRANQRTIGMSGYTANGWSTLVARLTSPAFAQIFNTLHTEDVKKMHLEAVKKQCARILQYQKDEVKSVVDIS